MYLNPSESFGGRFDDRSLPPRPKTELEKRVERNLIANRENARRQKANLGRETQDGSPNVSPPSSGEESAALKAHAVRTPTPERRSKNGSLQLSALEIRAREAVNIAASKAMEAELHLARNEAPSPSSEAMPSARGLSVREIKARDAVIKVASLVSRATVQAARTAVRHIVVIVATKRSKE